MQTVDAVTIIPSLNRLVSYEKICVTYKLHQIAVVCGKDMYAGWAEFLNNAGKETLAYFLSW